MRRALIVTVLATSSLVLLAMLIPLALLIGNYDLEDRLSRAALEVQATETVVSTQDRGMVSTYVERINARRSGITTTVLYPDGIGVGPHPGESTAVAQARSSGRARVDDVGRGARILVPVSLGGSSALPDQTPVVRIDVGAAPFPSRVHVAWGVLALLGLVILTGALVLADRIGTSFVRPIRRLADRAGDLGGPGGATHVEVEGPAEVQELARSLNRLVTRVETLLEREREGVADLSHRLRTPVTALRLNIDALPPGEDRARLEADVDRLHEMVDHLIHQARRSQREGLSARTEALGAIAARAAFWQPLAEDQERAFTVEVPDPASGAGPVSVAASPDDLEALVDVLLDNVFSHTPAGTALALRVRRVPDGIRLVVEDAGAGFPAGVAAEAMIGRGSTLTGSTGLGLAIADATARATGGRLTVESSTLGGACVVVELVSAR